jgi:hypothetical protein
MKINVEKKEISAEMLNSLELLERDFLTFVKSLLSKEFKSLLVDPQFSIVPLTESSKEFHFLVDSNADFDKSGTLKMVEKFKNFLKLYFLSFLCIFQSAVISG